MIFNRIWAMPNHRTFQIKPIKELLERYDIGNGWIDPFANYSMLAQYTNDLNKKYPTDYHLDAIEFISLFNKKSIDGVLYDPPYSLRQLKECYSGIGKSLTQNDTQSYFTKLKKSIAGVVKDNGFVISFGWNSNGIGKGLGFEPIEILLVPHGGNHNDTIVTVERKSIIDNLDIFADGQDDAE